MFDQLENSTLLDDMLLDRMIHRLEYQYYPNREYISECAIWRRWLA